MLLAIEVDMLDVYSRVFGFKLESFESVCRGLANVYYTFVRAFGGDDATPGKRDVDLLLEYEKAVEEYDALVAKEQAAGRLPVLE